MNKRTQEIMNPIVEGFVRDLDSRYGEHISNAMLVALLMYRLGEPGDLLGGSGCRADMIIEGDSNTSYFVACPVFETMLEDMCGSPSSGHHVAQLFVEAMKVGLKGGG